MSDKDSAEIALTHIAVCQVTHRVRFICQQCDRLFCGDCFTLAHLREKRDHDVEEIKDRLELEDKQIRGQMEELTKLAQNATEEANARDQKAQESIETLTLLITEVEQLMMTSASTRESQQLRQINRDCFALLQRVDKSRRSMDQESAPAIALETSRSLNAFLKQKLQRSNQAFNFVSGNRPQDLVPLILKSMVKFLEKKNVEGSKI